MNRASAADTSIAVQEQQLARMRALSPSDRFARALALSALGQEFAWAGAWRVAGSRGPDAVRRRFLEQAFGEDMADWVERRIAAESGS
ncbi:MAG: hypothetical protein U0974_00125 [Gemmatimonadales bacterium]|nr:hypothetical protein [Gemmatimonadales bacterium]MDZ4388125.1 hypothetical protein [Gemmatimonadales bacterium]